MDTNASPSRLRKILRLTFHRQPSNLTLAAPANLYRLLRSWNQEIRVLRIDASQPNVTDIRCTLETMCLYSDTGYKALSYEWGPPDVGIPPSRVFINSHEVSTTPNLRLALKHLESGPFYWIDALCINQSDDEERGHQVRLMTEIYRNASAVMVWLGLEQGDSKIGMEFLDEVGKPGNYNHTWIRDVLKNPEYNARWSGLRQIVQRSYWTRLWVIQELVVTTSPYEVWLLCGSNKSRFTYLQMVIQTIAAYVNEIPTFYFKGTPNDTIFQLGELATEVRDISLHVKAWQSKTEDRKQPKLTLLRLLNRYSQRQCSDPRDKVYALLGVSSTFPGTEFPITYAAPISEIYKNVAKYIIAGSGSLDILCWAGDDHHKTTSLPSWVPDWQHYNRTSRLLYIGWHSSGVLSGKPLYSADDETLITPSFPLGNITSMIKTGNSGFEVYLDSIDTVLKIAKEELKRWLEFVRSNLQPFTDSNNQVLEIYMRICYRLLFYPAAWPSTVDEKFPFPKFVRLCDEVFLPGGESIAKDDLSAESICFLADSVRKNRQLYAISLTPSNDPSPIDGSSGPGSLRGGSVHTRFGLCSRNARIQDVVTVVRGCKHPLVVRQVEGGRFELIGESYVYGFMNGEVLERTEEVEIELV
ncbi:HET domain containing protein [Hyaloscypha variabilis]